MTRELVIRLTIPDGVTVAFENPVQNPDLKPDLYSDYENEPLPPAPDAPAFRGMASGDRNTCPVHHEPWKIVPAGVSKKTQQPYSSFRACPIAGCNERPR